MFVTFYSTLKTIFKIKIKTSIYRHNNRLDFPYGTLIVTISCCYIKFTFCIKPEEQLNFLTSLMQESEQVLLGDVQTYYKHQKKFIELCNENDIYNPSETFIKELEKTKSLEIKTAINRFYQVIDVKDLNKKEKLKSLIKELEEIEKVMVFNENT